MTSEARHPESPPPIVSVRARAQEIEARTATSIKPHGQAGSSTPADSPKKHQVPTNSPPASLKSEETSPSRRCSEGDIFLHCKTRQPPPTAPRPRRVSLENATLPTVPERRTTLDRLAEKSEDSGSGEISCQTQATSKFTPFTSGGKSGVTYSQPATADFSPAIFSSSRLRAPVKPSPLDDIIIALEKICDEFSLPETACRRYSDDHLLDTSSLPRGYDDVFEKCYQRTRSRSTPRTNHDVNDKPQWPSEHGVPPVAECQNIKPVSTGKSSESKLLPDGSQSVKHASRREDCVASKEPIVYRSALELTPKSNERHVVSATLLVNPPKPGSKCESGKTVCSSPTKTVSSSDKKEKYFGRCEKLFRYKSTENPEEKSQKSSNTKSNIPFKYNVTQASEDSKIDACKSAKNVSKLNINPSISKVGQTFLTEEKAKDESTKVKSVAIKPNIPKIVTSFSLDESSSSPASVKNDVDRDELCPSEELEIVKNILASLDFEKYKRRSSLDDMENKSPKPPRANKSSSAKFKDLFDLLKPTSDNASSSKRPFGLCRSSSFSNTSDKDPPNFYLQNEENDSVTPLPEDSKKISTLPRRKSPSHQLFTKTPSPAPVPAVASCPSIVKLETRIPKIHDPDSLHDEGLVSDSEVGPGAYVTAYVNCVTSSPNQFSGRRGHVRSASDNVTSCSSTVLPEVRIKKTSSTEKLWVSVTSRLNGTEKQRKRRKGIGCEQTTGDTDQDLVKPGTGRSLTYPPQRKSSATEEHFTSVDSNGLKSLKLQTAGLMDSGSDTVRLLSDLSLADSHLCPSEGTIEETYLDVVDSVINSPSDPQHLSVDETNSSSNSKLHKKKHHSDPGGEIGSSGSGEGLIAEVIGGSSRSEPHLGGNESGVTPKTATTSSATEASSRVVPASHAHSDRSPLKLIIDGSKSGQGSQQNRGSVGATSAPGGTPNSRFHFPDSDNGNQRLTVEQNQSSKSPQEQRRYSKRRLRGPYGEMLEEEMRKSCEKQKSILNELNFLHDIAEARSKEDAAMATETASSLSSQNRPAMFLSSQSLDDASSTSSKNELSMSVTPKRKISANYPLLNNGESVAIASDEDISPTKLSSPEEPVVNNVASRNESTNAIKNECQPKIKEDVKGLNDFAKIVGRRSDTRTHVVAELYDTEKSYVESLQILANFWMKCIKFIQVIFSPWNILIFC